VTYVLASQLPVLIVLLCLGTVAKFAVVRSGREPNALAKLGPAVLVPGRFRAPALLACGAGELVLAGGLLVTTHPFFRWATVAFFAMSTYVLLELRRRRPDAGCGCFGALSDERIGRREIARAALLTVAALATLGGTADGMQVLTGGPWQTWALCALELAALTALSREPAALLRRRRRPAVPCERRRSPLRESQKILRRSRPWRRGNPGTGDDRE